tara:strand:- start:133 stop:747 length:615 start_codon:yes stop_codon:yes gene_type:complete
MKKLAILSILALFLSGCAAFYQGQLGPSNVVFTTNNFQVTKSVQGEASAKYFFGIGGIKRSGLVKEARDNMYATNKLQANEMITNVTLDSRHYFLLYPIYYKHTVYVTADVIRVNSTGNLDGESMNSENSEKSHQEIINSFGIKEGSELYFKARKDQMVKSTVQTINSPIITVDFNSNGKKEITQKLYTDFYIKKGDEYISLSK